MSDPSSAHPASAGIVFSRGGLMLADGTFFEGTGFGAVGSAIGEVCFNTAMTGYQEILTDPSYAAQIVAFTFPHIGIVGTNGEDLETTTPVVRGLVVRADAEHPSNYRNLLALDGWLKKHNIPAVAGIDTRALTSLIREKGMPHGVIANPGGGELDREALIAQAKRFAGLEGLDLAKDVTCTPDLQLGREPWAWPEGYGKEGKPSLPRRGHRLWRQAQHPARSWRASAPTHRGAGHRHRRRGDAPPAAWRAAVQRPGRSGRDRRICRAPDQGWSTAASRCSASAWATRCWPWRWARKTMKMEQGHHGANHPVKDLTTGKVEIVSMNHGFTVERDSLPEGVDRDPRLAVRRHQRRPRAEGPAGVLRPAPPGSVAGPDGQPLSVRAFRRSREEADLAGEFHHVQKRFLNGRNLQPQVIVADAGEKTDLVVGRDLRA